MRVDTPVAGVAPKSVDSSVTAENFCTTVTEGGENDADSSAETSTDFNEVINHLRINF